MLTAPARLHRAELTGLAGMALGDLTVGMRDVPLDDAHAFRDALASLLADLAGAFAGASASLGADWYDELRSQAEVRGRFSAIVADLPDVGRTDALAGWAVEPMFGAEPDAPAALSRAEGGLQRIIFDADRATVARSSIADPRASGWQRTGSGECPFCEMLIARGAVYSEATANFSSHDHCKCVAVPAFGGQPVPVKAFTPSTRKITDADRARVREYLAANPTAGPAAPSTATARKAPSGAKTPAKTPTKTKTKTAATPGAQTAERAASARAQLASYEQVLASGGGNDWMRERVTALRQELAALKVP